MIPTHQLLAALLAVATSAPALATTPAAEVGDPARGAALYRLHCAACHGADARGNGLLSRTLTSPAPANLRDPAFLMKRGDAELVAAIQGGGKAVKAHFTMPGLGETLGTLDLWDVIAFLRRGQLGITDFFPEAARYTAKTYAIDVDGQRRIEPIVGKLGEDEIAVPIVAVFGGEPGEHGPAYVPQDPRLLDELKPKKKMGFLSCLPVSAPGVAEPVPTCLALDRDGTLKSIRLAPGVLPDAERARVEKLFAAFQGQRGKRGEYRELQPGKLPAKEAKLAAEAAKGLTRAYYRALEGSQMFDKEERERHWAD